MLRSTCSSSPTMQGMSLVPAVTELLLAELMYLQYDNPTKPILMYINSAGVQVSNTHPHEDMFIPASQVRGFATGRNDTQTRRSKPLFAPKPIWARSCAQELGKLEDVEDETRNVESNLRFLTALAVCRKVQRHWGMSLRRWPSMT